MTLVPAIYRDTLNQIQGPLALKQMAQGTRVVRLDLLRVAFSMYVVWHLTFQLIDEAKAALASTQPAPFPFYPPPPIFPPPPLNPPPWST